MQLKIFNRMYKNIVIIVLVVLCAFLFYVTIVGDYYRMYDNEPSDSECSLYVNEEFHPVFLKIDHKNRSGELIKTETYFWEKIDKYVYVDKSGYFRDACAPPCRGIVDMQPVKLPPDVADIVGRDELIDICKRPIWARIIECVLEKNDPRANQ